jgi:hypothetical protein
VNAADRDRIVEMLLEDPPPSCRAVSRATGYSDWTIRRIRRAIDGDPRPMKQRASRSQPSGEEVSALTSWLILGGIVAAFALMIWAGVRWTPPPESQEFPDSSPRPFDYRKENDET